MPSTSIVLAFQLVYRRLSLVHISLLRGIFMLSAILRQSPIVMRLKYIRSAVCQCGSFYVHAIDLLSNL